MAHIYLSPYFHTQSEVLFKGNLKLFLATKILSWPLNFHVWWSIGNFISEATLRAAPPWRREESQKKNQIALQGVLIIWTWIIMYSLFDLIFISIFNYFDSD